MNRFVYFLKALGLASLFVMIGPFFAIAPAVGLLGTIPYSIWMTALKNGDRNHDFVLSVAGGISIALILGLSAPLLAIGMLYQIFGLILGMFFIPVLLSDKKKKRKKR